ncbi:taste receptor type 1 member 1-like [Anguilla anguilla]|uniref:taste receptor type 1 member 1-like n=1 Tax=Anguilla anguilla TaxID=7936 RepID=UPI0015B1D2BC|nr:taste receptor type 1 member 1-like [Anguilla anguilla]
MTVFAADPTECRDCRRDEWSANGSVRCTKRSVEHLIPMEPVGVGILLSAASTLLSSLAIAGLFACRFHTPVVRSAGGSMCFLMLGCLCLCSVSVFFYVGRPGPVHCFLRNPAFAVFYTGCMSCLAIRSFQIVCIFKMASRLPRAYDYWVKHNGQWAAVGVAMAVQLLLCGLWIGVDGPQPISHTMGRAIVFDCSLGNSYIFYTIMVFLGLLSVACFSFAYMGTDLPKNYNEGKSITFSLVVFYISWAMYLTAYLTLTGKYLPAVNAFSVLSTLLGILVGYFFPKCYIIIFKPQHNTAAFFQTAIQSYTINSNT